MCVYPIIAFRGASIAAGVPGHSPLCVPALSARTDPPTHARAALAAEAAGAQTDLWTMHEHLFEHQNHLEELDLQKYATELGLDADRFERDRRSPEIARRIDQDVNSGERSGVDGTPTFYVNGIRHDGGYDLESLRPAIVTSIQRISKAR